MSYHCPGSCQSWLFWSPTLHSNIKRAREKLLKAFKIHSVIQLWTSLCILITWGLNNCMSALFCVKTCIFFLRICHPCFVFVMGDYWKKGWMTECLTVLGLLPLGQTVKLGCDSSVSAAQLLVGLANTSDSEHSFRSTLVHFSLETYWFNYCLVVLSLPLVKCWSFLAPLTIINWISYMGPQAKKHHGAS